MSWKIQITFVLNEEYDDHTLVFPTLPTFKALPDQTSNTA